MDPSWRCRFSIQKISTIAPILTDVSGFVPMNACEAILRPCLDRLIQLLKSASTTKKNRKPTKIGRNQRCFFFRNICFCVVQFHSTLDPAFFLLLAFSFLKLAKTERRFIVVSREIGR